jgi:2,3-diaminopropionate biosynthesis protein SbnB
MSDESILLVTGRQVETALAGRHKQIIDVIRGAYEAHGRQADTLPQASILRFADHPRNRIIALPARLDLGTDTGDTADTAGVKWISSFPANTETGLERASAVILMNSMRTGRVTAVIEGSVISAKRTAASAALAAAEVHGASRPGVLGLIGCGRINYEILQFILAAGPAVRSVIVYDQSASRADAFVRRCAVAAPDLAIGRAGTAAEVLGTCSLVSFATTATEPYVTDLSMCPPGSTILHISLRDIAPSAILNAENLVDDVDHVCAARTSVHLAEQAVGHRRFIRTTICDVLLGRTTARADAALPLVFSPFGMGTLDIALAGLVLETARAEAPAVPDFWPMSWQSDAPAAASARRVAP